MQLFASDYGEAAVVVIAALLSGVAVAAGLVPAVRATLIDPLKAFRSE